MQQMPYSIINQIKGSALSAVSRLGITSFRSIRSNLAVLMNRTDSTPRRLILSAPPNETVCDLSYQSHDDTVNMLMVCYLSNRINDSPSVLLGPIVNVPARAPSPFLRSKRNRQGAEQLSQRVDLAKRCATRSPNADISPDQTTWSGPRRNARLT